MRCGRLDCHCSLRVDLFWVEGSRKNNISPKIDL
jgi:hypothetical protein